MSPRAVHLIVRVLRMAPIVALMFSGCTCSEKSPDEVASPVTAPAKAPTSAAPPANAAPPTDTVLPSTPTVEEVPAEAPPAADTVSDAKRSECETSIAVLSGRTKDAALLDKPQLQALVNSDLVMCGVVFSDSDEMCTKLWPTEHGPGVACRRIWSTFHEMRAYPKGRSFMFEEVDWNECRTAPFPGPAVCDAFREAMRSADVAKCDAAGVLKSVCQAYINLDPSMCRLEGTLEQTTIELPDKKEDGKIDIRSAYEEHCRKTIAERKPLAKGLEALTKSDQEQQRELAKAALGQKDACAPFMEAATRVCVAVPPQTPGSGAEPKAASPAPQDEAPKTPQAEAREVS